MANKRSVRWIIFVIVTILSVSLLIFLKNRHDQILYGGMEFQWPVRLKETVSWLPKDYLEVDFLNTQAKWIDSKEVETPRPNETVYISLGVEPSGLLFIKGASSSVPAEGLYMRAKTVVYKDGIVYFSVPFNRVKIDVKKVNPAFYTNYQPELIATLKLREGRGVVTGIYAKGVALTAAEPETEKNTDEKKESNSGSQ